MAKIDWPAWETIDELAKRMGVGDHARHKWRQRGVPHRYRLPLLERAQQLGKTLTKDDFEPSPFESRGAEKNVVTNPVKDVA